MKPADAGIDNPFASRAYDPGQFRVGEDLDERLERPAEPQPVEEVKQGDADPDYSPTFQEAAEFKLNDDSEAESRARLAEQMQGEVPRPPEEEQEPPVI